MIGLLSVLLLLCPSHSFYTGCPSAGQWYLRGGVKCTSEEQYTCLPDFNDHIYNESCSGPKGALQGERIVISNKNLDIKPCNAERYQPDLFSTNQGSVCLFQKGNCSEEGLVIYSNGTSEMDRTCRCDYTRGFAFVSSNRTDPCSCNAATEDCSCYKKECNGSQVLSSDYQCIEQYMATQSTCSEIPDTINRDLNESSIQSEKTTEVKLQGSSDIHFRIAFTFAIIVCVIVWWFLFMIQEYLTSKLKILMNWNPPVVILRDLPNEVKIGEDVTIKCTVTSVSDCQLHWLKIINQIKTEITPEEEDEKYGHFTEKIPSLVIKNVEESDEATYICYASNRFGDSERKQTDLKVTGDIIISKLKETVCIEHQNITFCCEVYKSNMQVKWFKENIEITKTLDKYRWIIESKDEVHKLTIRQVERTDSGNYSIQIKDKRSTASLIVLEGMSAEESNLFHICFLLQKVAVPIVRMKFDSEFHPEMLANTLRNKKETLKDLNSRKIINRKEYETLFPRKEIYTVCFMLSNIQYSSELNEKENKRFKSLAHDIKIYIEDILSDVKGKQEVNVLKFHPTYIVRIEVTSDTSEDKIKEVMSSATKDNNIKQFPVCESEYVFQSNESLCTADIMFIDLKTNDTEKLEDKTSPEFQRMSTEIVSAISKLCSDEKVENVSATVRNFKQHFLATTLEFKTEELYGKDEIKKAIELAVKVSPSPHLNGLKVLSLKLKNYEYPKELVPSSQNLSMRLMICLLQNLAGYRIGDSLPEKVLTNVDSDITRIRYYRNVLAHVPVTHIGDKEFGEMVDDLKEALHRLGSGTYLTLINKFSLNMKKSTSQQDFLRLLKINLDKSLESVPETDQLDYSDVLSSGSEMEKDQQNSKIAFLLNRLVERVTREMFNKEFPPSSLKCIIEEKKDELRNLKKENKLTQTQFESLIPPSGDAPSSEKFGFALMVRIVWELRKKEAYNTKEMYDTLRELERLTDGLKKFNYSQKKIAKIVKILKGLGVMDYLQIIY